MKKYSIRKTAAIMLMAAAIPAAAMANVAPRDQSVKVSFADLDVHNVAGQKVLYQRLKLAASKICGPMEVHMAGSLSRARANQQCYAETLSDAVDKLDMPSIQALHGQ